MKIRYVLKNLVLPLFLVCQTLMLQNRIRMYSHVEISDGWIKKFMERNNYSVRAVTHKSQENTKDQLAKAKEIVDYLA